MDMALKNAIVCNRQLLALAAANLRIFPHLPSVGGRAIQNSIHAAKMACFDDKESNGAGAASSS
jgi:hypothetical protein